MPNKRSHHGTTNIKKTLNLIKQTFTVTALAAILYIALNNRDELITIFLSAEIISLCTSIFLWILLHILSPLFTVFSFKLFGNNINYKKAFIIHNKRLPAKYIPGGIWHTVARVNDYHNEGVSASSIGKYIAFENIAAIVIALTIGCILISQNTQDSSIHSATTLLSVIGITTILTPILLKLLSHKLMMNISLKKYYISILITAAYWSIAAASFIYFIKSFTNLNIETNYSMIGGTYLLSWGIGYIAIFAPQGIGISELISASLLKNSMQAAGLIPTIAAFRAIILIGDIIAWSSTFFIKKQN